MPALPQRVLAVLYGIGKNGKSTLVELFHDLMADYSSVAHPNTIMHTKYGDATAQYQLAELPGVRFVSMSETKRGVELEEAVVKQITGNDTISARSPYGKPFFYRPQFKLWMSTNHKPEIPDGSEAIWDRIKLIPFNQRFDGKDADPKLPQALREELPGVLAWAVLGCVEWGQEGLGTSAAVEKATLEYRAETDVIDQFFADVCVFGPEQRVSKKWLFEAWENWCYESGEEPGKQNGFTRVMKERGKVRNFEEGRSDKTRVWKGIGLAGSDPEDGGVVNEEGGVADANNANSDSPVPEKYPASTPSEKVSRPQNPRKHVGVAGSPGHFSENLSKGSQDTPPEGTLRKNDEKVSLPSQSVPDVLTAPASWTFEGIEIDYMPEGE